MSHKFNHEPKNSKSNSRRNGGGGVMAIYKGSEAESEYLKTARAMSQAHIESTKSRCPALERAARKLARDNMRLEEEIRNLKSELEMQKAVNNGGTYRARIEGLKADNDGLIKSFLNASNRAARYREALEFYADKNNYDEDGAPGNDVGVLGYYQWETDHGSTAREALEVKNG